METLWQPYGRLSILVLTGLYFIPALGLLLCKALNLKSAFFAKV